MATRLGKVGYTLLAALLLTGTAHAQRYPWFGPADGILVGSTSTYQTTAAAWANIQALLTGTCDSSHVVNGAGGCVTPAAGTITGITWAVPSGFSISGSPCTSGSCAFTLSTSLSGVLKGTGSGFTAAASSDILGLFSGTCSASTVLNGSGACAAVVLGSQVTGTLSASNGGTGEAGTITGILKGNGTSAHTAAVASDVTALFSGTCSSITFLRGDGACASTGSGGTPGGSNTDVQYNNSGAFGGASNFTFNSSTGGVTITAPSSGLNLTVSSAGNADAVAINSTTANFAGLEFNVSTGPIWAVRASTAGLFLSNVTASINPFEMESGGQFILGSPTAPAANFTNVGDVNAVNYWVNGAPMGVFGELNNNGTSCTIINTNNNIINCIRNSVGDLTVSFGTANADYVCSASAVTGTAAMVTVYARTTSSVSVRVFNSSGTLVDDNADIICN